MVLIMPAERRTFSDIDRTPSFFPDTVLIMPAERRTFSDSAIGARLRPKSINLTMPAERRTFSDVTIIDFRLTMPAERRTISDAHLASEKPNDTVTDDARGAAYGLRPSRRDLRCIEKIHAHAHAHARGAACKLRQPEAYLQR